MSDGLSIQISDLDSYHSAPSHLDQFQSAPKVPIVRIYGTLRVPDQAFSAYNILVHVHNCYPYFYIDCPEDDDTLLNDAYLERLSVHLERAIAESFQRKSNKTAHDEPSNSNSDSDPDAEVEGPDVGTHSEFRKYIASVKLCRGSPVYGYAVGYAVVLKISFFSPLYKTRLFKLLSSNAIDFAEFRSKNSARPPNVYEAHLNYLSQFLADFNLHPCGYLNTDTCYFRSPIAFHNGLPILPLKEYLATFILRNNVLNPVKYPRMGRSLLEIDIHVGSISNRASLRQRHVHNDFTEFTQGTASDQIYLSSLQLTFDDLKYQCVSRDNTNTSQLLHESYSQVFTKLGRRGYEDWESRPQHEQQLSFVQKLNKPTAIGDVSVYYDKRVKSGLRGTQLPTTFELVELSLPLDYYEKVPMLNYRDDLIKWTSYEKLFEDSTANMSMESIDDSTVTREPKQSNTDVITPQVSPIKLHPTKENAEFSPFKNTPEKRRPSQDHDDDIPEAPSRDDLQLFLLTQHNVPNSTEEAVSSSADSFLSQTSHELLRNPRNTWEYNLPPKLLKTNFQATATDQNVLEFDYVDPSYHDPADAHSTPLVFGNKIIPVPLRSDSSIQPINFIKTFQLTNECVASDTTRFLGTRSLWQYARSAPSRKDVMSWLTVDETSDEYKKKKFRSQIEPLVTQTNEFKYSLRAKNVVRSPSGFLNMSLLGMELHVNTSGGMRPNPEKDPVQFIIYHFDNANQMYEDGKPKTAILVFLDGVERLFLRKVFGNISVLLDTEIRVFNTEKEMVEDFVHTIDRYDPDIISGYEVNAASWGYLCERFQTHYNIDLVPRFSKVNSKGNGKFGDRWGYTHTSNIKINGRHLFNVWRFMKNELKLTSYSLENISFHLLHRTLPRISSDQLSEWWRSAKISKLIMVCNYHKHRMDLTMDIIDSQEMVLRNVEASRLLGVNFYSNYYRGSQFKVESLLMRIARPENALLNSPSKAQVHATRPIEVIPLVMEPESNFFKSPLVVLDFQSLYPSIMIAYNYCYSTLLGRLEGYRQDKNPVGYLPHHKLPLGLIDLLKKNDGINISPNGMMFVAPKFRKSILSRMLQEILNMRINVKSVASAFRDDKELGKLLNSKQLALKLIANVTYGYTSATFSGRMPNPDIADAIVATGRELMRRSIEIIEASPYNAKVTYGDTDSLFVYFPGRSREYAFKYGKLLAEQITETLPDPIKLKFEKVYHPCVLLAKKRYVGHCYEFESQTTPTFEAKGIETIRRDGIPAQSKMVGKSLRILFETKNLSEVKKYVVKQFFKILLNRVNASDFCFAKGVRYGTYKNERYLPPGAVVAQKNIERDPRSEPQYKERVPYLVMRDSTKERLRDRCVPPELYMASYNTDNPRELDFEYYINKVLIPPLERIFNLMGVNVKEWYKEMPKSTKSMVMKQHDILKISGFMRSEECFRCGSKLDGSSKYVCRSCRSNELVLVNDLIMAGREKQEKMLQYESVCNACSSSNFEQSGVSFGGFCVNQDCRTYYAKVKSIRECEQYSNDKARILAEMESSW